MTTGRINQVTLLCQATNWGT